VAAQNGEHCTVLRLCWLGSWRCHHPLLSPLPLVVVVVAAAAAGVVVVVVVVVVWWWR